MHGPISKTFRTLTVSANPHALEVLLSALDVDLPEIERAAVEALIQRANPRGQMELLRRLPRLSRSARDCVESRIHQLDKALHQALLFEVGETASHALELVRHTRYFGQLSALLKILMEDEHPLQESVAETIRELTNFLYEYFHEVPNIEEPRVVLSSPERVRNDALKELSDACSQFEKLAYAEIVVEAILALGEVDHFAVKKVLVQASPECRELANTLLATSTHPGAMQLILDFMANTYPPSKAFEILKTRTEPEFVQYLLRSFPERLTPNQQKNFRQLESVAWLNRHAEILETIPPALQKSLVNFVLASGVSSDLKLHVQEWLVRHGGSPGRLAAAEVLVSMAPQKAQHIVIEGLDAEDPQVQAWATGQLRPRKVPEALTLLIQRLDSPLPEVRDAARAELGSFSLERVLGFYDQLDPDICLKVGTLLRKIETHAVDKLAELLNHPIRRRRIQAARASLALGYHSLVSDRLIAMLQDEDSIVRRIVAEILAYVPTMEVVEALLQLRQDPSIRVRETVARSLETIRRSGSRHSPDDPVGVGPVTVSDPPTVESESPP